MLGDGNQDSREDEVRGTGRVYCTPLSPHPGPEIIKLFPPEPPAILGGQWSGGGESVSLPADTYQVRTFNLSPLRTIPDNCSVLFNSSKLKDFVN